MSELGRIYSLLPPHEMAIRFGLIDPHPRKKTGRKSYFSPKGKVALMFLKSYILAELRRLDRENPCAGLFSDKQLSETETITKIYRQQRWPPQEWQCKGKYPQSYRKRQ